MPFPEEGLVYDYSLDDGGISKFGSDEDEVAESSSGNEVMLRAYFCSENFKKVCPARLWFLHSLDTLEALARRSTKDHGHSRHQIFRHHCSDNGPDTRIVHLRNAFSEPQESKCHFQVEVQCVKGKPTLVDMLVVLGRIVWMPFCVYLRC